MNLEILGRSSMATFMKTLSFLLLVSTMTWNALVSSVGAQATEIRVVNPETGAIGFEFYTNTTLVGTRFNVTINVYDVDDLADFQVLLVYNSSVINGTRAWTPSDDPEYVFFGKNPLGLPAYFYYDDPVWGTSVLVGDTIFGVDTFSGEQGLLAIIEFEIVKKPTVDHFLTCTLEIDNADTFLRNSATDDIVAARTNGYYRFTWAAQLTYLVLAPQTYETTELEIFNLTVWLNNTISQQELVYIEFMLKYDPAILNVTQVTEGTFLTAFGDTTFNSTFDAGSVTIENYINPPYSPPYPEGNGPIATITFEGIYQDIVERYCTLRFLNTQFLNTTAGTVTVVTINGSYKIAETAAEITINLHSEDWVKYNGEYKVLEGSLVVINGTITPAKEDVNVTIYVILAVDPRVLTSALTDVNGHYTYPWLTNETGGLSLLEIPLGFKAEWEEGTEVIAESDPWQSLEIVPALEESEISISINPTTVVLGRDVVISGDIQPYGSAPFVNVSIYYRPENETDWIEIAKVKTNSDGHYSYRWTVQNLGTYIIKSSWLGDLPFVEGAESDEVTLNVVETAPWDIMAYVPYIIAVIIVVVLVILYFKKFR